MYKNLQFHDFKWMHECNSGLQVVSQTIVNLSVNLCKRMKFPKIKNITKKKSAENGFDSLKPLRSETHTPRFYLFN